ncbi:Ig-like domain-containing protein, partial [Candidatus Dojkabacteria bacterium]|nr:Ig-like domain-containing protein [Candidatus Dojkabacteria bacterium]
MEDNTSHKTENIVKEAFQKRHSMPAHRKAQLDRLIVNKINEVKQEEEISEFYHEEIAAIEAEANSAGLAFGKTFFQTMAAMATMAMLLGIVLLITFVNIDFLKTEEISVTEFASSLRVEPIAFSDSGVDVNSEFILETDSKVKLTAEEIEKNIVITPEIDFSVVAQDNSYAIVPLEELEENTHYQITLPQGTEIAGTVITDALVWEFTTEEGLQILGLDLVVTDDYGDVLIADLNFNDIDLDSIENNFLTMPLIDVKEFVAEDNKLIIIPEDASDLYQPVDIAFDKGIKDKSGKNLAD